MARSDPLNAKQLETLKRVAAGDDLSSPDRIPLRITARALQSRGLVTIRKNNKTWQAQITEDGTFYLQHGHPRPIAPSRAGHPQPVSKKVTHGPIRLKREPAKQIPKPPAPPPVPAAQPSPSSVVVDRQRSEAAAIVETVCSDGFVHHGAVNYEQEKRLSELVDYANRNGLTPNGYWLVEDQFNYYIGAITHLVKGDFSSRRPDAAADIPVPERLSRPHRVVAALNKDAHQMRMPKPQRQRALRLLQAIADEAVSRGYEVKRPSGDQVQHHRRYGRIAEIREGAIVVVIGGVEFTVTIDQEYPQSNDPVRAAKLELSVHPCHPLQHTWADRKTIPLDQRLPRVFETLEASTVIHRHRKLVSETVAANRQRRWEQAMARAKERAEQAHLGRALTEHIECWQRSQVIEQYCEALRARIEQAPLDEPSLTSATQWLQWAQEYATTINPLRDLPSMPDTPEFKPDDLKPFLDGWSPYGPESHRRG